MTEFEPYSASYRQQWDVCMLYVWYCIQGPISQLWWFYGNMTPYVGNYMLWFAYIICIDITLFASAFVIIRR